VLEKLTVVYDEKMKEMQDQAAEKAEQEKNKEAEEPIGHLGSIQFAEFGSNRYLEFVNFRAGEEIQEPNPDFFFVDSQDIQMSMPELMFEFRDGRIDDFISESTSMIPLFNAKIANFTLKMLSNQ
jgi:hypothetical protein